MDVTPLIPSNAQVIQSYADGGFKVSAQSYTGAQLVFVDRVQSWEAATQAASAQDISIDMFQPLVDLAKDIDVVLFGTGAKLFLLPAALRADLKEAGLVVEVMDTPAACRTYNVLLSEGRRVVAAMLPVR